MSDYLAPYSRNDKLKLLACSYMGYNFVFWSIQLRSIRMHKHHFNYTFSQQVMGY